MIRILLCSLLFLILISCRYIGPVDDIIIKNLKSKPDSVALVGTWEVDNLSYDLVRKQYNLSNRKIKLRILKNGDFQAENFPDFVKDGFGRSIDNKLLNANGKWELEKIDNRWNLVTIYHSGQLYIMDTWIPNALYLQKGELTIWIWIGDPDEGNRLLFKKIE